MSKLYLQDIIDDISFENLPVKWQGFDLNRFSKHKTLFDFQKQCLQNAIKALWLYFKEKNANKTLFLEHYKRNGLEENFDYDLKKKQDSKTAKYLLEYDKDYPVINHTISFAHFINRMSFWMATGSGKTLVIVKLIEMLGNLSAKKELPSGDILFLTHREDLLDQFKNHVEEFNSFYFDTRINLKNLKNYEMVKRENSLPFSKNEITVFFYRSDLISDQNKEKIVNFQNYDNGGKWYILLDEAHKGDKEDSKRQILYSILSRNGFLFNFSATFTDPRDFATCAFNFNLSKFVEEGYGKHIYVSSADINVFRDRSDFSPIEKQKIVLKTLLLLTYLNKHLEEIRKFDDSLYHRPILLTLVNSVDVKQSDLELFFRELENVAKNEIRSDLLQEKKEELIQEFRNHDQFMFEDSKVVINADLISTLGYNDIVKYVFHADKPGKIEVLKIPGNKQELIFRLMTSDKPFALIKIGDISGWLKEKLEGYEINERFENESYFNRLNTNDSDINILMGSRSFYEGWDSNRPNIVLFVNIGVGSDAKKFVLQSVGRGIRIEPRKNKRKRLQHILNEKSIKEELFEKVKNFILPIESLFVFGTNAENLKEIIATLQTEKQDKNFGDAFMVNPKAQEHTLLIPVYKTTETILAEEKNSQKYPISRDDFDITSQFYTFLGHKVSLVKYDCNVRILKKTEESFSHKDRYYDFSENNSLSDPNLLLGRIFNYFGVKNKDLDAFKELENEILHFRKISMNDTEKYDEIKRKIEVIRRYPEIEKALDEQYGKITREEFQRQMSLFENAKNFEIKNQTIKIKYLPNHYYIPVLLSETEKINYFHHIINVYSEVKFIEELEEYLQESNNIFSQFDWWMFSKLDQTLDEISIPYYNPKENAIAHFKPDFIFWIQKGQHYLILFVDPKGTEHTDGYRKIDGYSRLFEEMHEQTKKTLKKFYQHGYTIQVKLLFKSHRGIANVLEEYRQYWFDNCNEFAFKINEIIH